MTKIFFSVLEVGAALAVFVVCRDLGFGAFSSFLVVALAAGCLGMLG
jgi:hypothetical protein